MKSLLLLALLITNSAHAWENIIHCDGAIFAVDRAQNAEGEYIYQTVFRGQLVESMLDQQLITPADLNTRGELVRESEVASGILSHHPIRRFQLTNRYSQFKNYSVIFHDRGGQIGNYVFHSCWIQEN